MSSHQQRVRVSLLKCSTSLNGQGILQLLLQSGPSWNKQSMIYMILESLYLDGVIWWEQLRLFKAKSSAVILIMIFWWYEDTQCAEITHRSPKVHNDTVSLSLQWSWFWHLWNTKNRHSVGGHTMCFTWIIKPCVLLFGLLPMFLPFLLSSDKALSLQSGTSAWFIYALRGLHWSNTWAEKKKKKAFKALILQHRRHFEIEGKKKH